MSPTTFDSNYRGEFPGLARMWKGRRVAFFDGPAGSQVPKSVADAMAHCLTFCNANDGGTFESSREVSALAVQARHAVADLLHVDEPDTVVLGPNMTSLTFALSRSLARTWKPGDEVIVTRMDHDANIRPWLLAADEVGVKVRWVEVTSDCRLRMDMFSELLSERTKLVAVGLASNAVGTINPIAEIAAAAHRVGALMFVDAVHAVPHRLVDVQQLAADFLVCSAYKFFGPHQGILWGRRELLEKLPAYKVRPAPNSLPGKWMTGTPSFEAMAGTQAAIAYLERLGSGDDRRHRLAAAYQFIANHERQLAKRFLAGMASLSDWKVWGITDPGQLDQRVATFGLTSNRLTPQHAAERLAEQGICVWAGHFYAIELIEALGLAPHGLLRIGFLHYNSADEVDRLLEALRDINRNS
jgi:cysteine desulfurase family protein (TIGR01976 family)